MLRFLKYFRGLEWLFIVLLIALNVGQAILDLTLPEYMGNIVDLVLAKSGTSKVVIEGLIMLSIALGSIVLLIVSDFIASVLTARYTRRMRALVYDKVQSMSQATMNNFTTASLITRSTNDITQVGNALSMGFKVAIYAPIIAIFAFLKIIDKSSSLSLATGVSIIALVLLIVVVFGFAVPKFKKIQKLTDKVNGINRENLMGLRVVRAYNAENYQKDKFEETNQNLRRENTIVGRLMSGLNPIMNLIMNGLSLAIVWIGAYLINDGALDIPTMTEFTMYAMQVVMGFLLLSIIFILVPRATVSLKRIYEVLDAKENIFDGKGIELSKINAQNDSDSSINAVNAIDSNKNVEAVSEKIPIVEFRNVCFKYPDAEESVLNNISFSCYTGQTIAFIGSTGSGKSTLINLIPRFYDATSGQVLINGIDVKDYKLSELHAMLGYVPQKGILFKGTVRENVDFGDNKISDEQIEWALKVAQSYDFVSKMGGLDAEISQNGSNLSGGQKQRLSIARALANKPPICIFDDSFSALDYKTDKRLRASLKKEMKDSTKFIVAQRIGTIKDADLIVVLDSGEIVGMGRHEDLIKNCQVYIEIANSQLSKEEINGTIKK